jgi:hypothetical protein
MFDLANLWGDLWGELTAPSIPRWPIRQACNNPGIDDS